MLFNKKIIIGSPITGQIVSLEKVNDPVFSQKMMGDGIAIIPNENILVAPCDGVISAIAETNHAVGITTEDGIELIIHIGLETMKIGEGYFTIHVVQDQKILKGQKLISFDRDSLLKKGYDTITMLVFPNTNKKKMKLIYKGDRTISNSPVIELK